jgi:hypothetical protein
MTFAKSFTGPLGFGKGGSACAEATVENDRRTKRNRRKVFLGTKCRFMSLQLV